jgi:L-fuconolactonase
VGRDLDAQVENPAFVAGIKDLAAADLTLDIVLTSPSTIETMVRLTDRVPTLRVVLDHLPNLTPPAQPAELHAHERNLCELAKRDVYAKVSEVQQVVDGKVRTDLAFYKPRLDMIWDIFGEDRLLFGSDWPQTALNWVSMATVIAIVHDYFFEKGRPAAEKYFWKNSLAAYKWVKRDTSQPSV